MTKLVSDASPDARDLRAALEWGYRNALQELGDLLASLGVSLAEAAYRGDDIATIAHIKQGRLVVVEAIQVAKDLQTLKSGGGLPEKSAA